MNPVGALTSAIGVWKQIRKLDYDPAKKIFFEVGTGRVPVAPLAYWLMGADRIITVDINPYLKPELMRESLQYISKNDKEIKSLFGTLLEKERLEQLIHFLKDTLVSIDAFYDLCRIEYIALGDAADTGLSPRSIDFYTSCSVFEHIPPNILKQILEEGNRIVGDDGLFVHRIDYSDHFSHTDKSISPINFLQYSDAEWDKLAGNKYMYANRLRHDDYLAMFQSTGHRILATDVNVDESSLELLESGSLRLDERFSKKSKEILAITGSWIVSKKNG